MIMGRRRFYDWLSRYYGFVGLFDNRYKRVAVDEVEMPTGGRFLDVGCGDGYALRYASRSFSGCDFFGVDGSYGMVKRANDGGVGRVLYGDCFFLPFKSGLFDVLFSSFVFDLFLEDEHVMIVREFSRVLDEGGVLVLVNNARGSGVFYMISGLYVVLARLFPKLLLNRPIDASDVVGNVGGFRLVSRRIVGFTEIAVFVKVKGS